MSVQGRRRSQFTVGHNMASASEEPSAHSAPAQAADTGKQERKNLPGSRRSNKRNEEDEKEGGTGSNVGSGSRNKRRDLGRAEWGYFCCQYPNFSPD